MTVQNKDVLLKFSSFSFEDIQEEHINKMPFSGNCLPIGTPSDGIPYGADKPIIFYPEAITKALDTFKGMGVDCVYDNWSYPYEALTGHDNRFKIGVVESANINGNSVNITGHLWKKDFSDVCFMIKNAKDSLGFSVEVKVNDMEEDENYWYIKDFVFTGVAILYKNLAAFKDTQLAASRKKEEMEGGNSMDEKTMKALVEELVKTLDFANVIAEALKPVNERLEKLEAKEIDFSAVNEKLTAIESKFEAKPKEKEVEAGEKQPERKTETNLAGKKDELSASEKLAAEIEKIDNDKFLSASDKLKKKMEIWHKSMKAE